MRIINIVLSSISLILSLLVLLIHWPTRNSALLILSSVAAVTQFTLLAGGISLQILFQNNVSFVGGVIVADGDVGIAGRVVCEMQAFALNALGIALYGACLSLAIELLIRTRSNVILGGQDPGNSARTWLYMILSLVIPTALVVVLIVFRPSSAYYINKAYCDNASTKIIFTTVFVASLGLYTIGGSALTVSAVITYARKRQRIIRDLEQAYNAAFVPTSNSEPTAAADTNAPTTTTSPPRIASTSSRSTTRQHAKKKTNPLLQILQ
ncbi:hypothetical protein HDU76_009137, partial [Blyttiomyces sp. JEL0837]